MANLLTRWFAADIDRIADKQVQALLPTLQQQDLNLYNQNVFQWIGYNQMIIDFEDKHKFITEGFQTNADVYTCIDLISKKVSECKYTLFEVKAGTSRNDIKHFDNLRMSDDPGSRLKAIQLKEQLFEEVDDRKHPILKLLDNPNPMQNYEEWVTDLAGFFLCTGDGYIMGNGVSEEAISNRIWSELFSLPSHYMIIVSGGMFDPILGYKLATVYQQEVQLPANQVHHFKSFNPDFTMTGASLYGQSPMKAIYRNILKENLGDAELLKQIKNGGAMGFISPDGDGVTLTKPQLDLLKEKITAAKEGDSLMDRIFPSTGPLKWTQIGLPSVDLQIIESLNLDTKKIYSAFHVPMIYSSSEEASNMSNVSSAPKQLIYNAVGPLLRKIRDSINKFVCDPYAKAEGVRYYIDYDMSSYPEMGEDMNKLSEWLAASPEVTLNEKRIAKGYDRLEDPLMDKIYIPANLVPLEDISLDMAYNQPMPQLPPATQEKSYSIPIQTKKIEIKEVAPIVDLDFVPARDLANSSDPFGYKDRQDKIKLELKKLKQDINSLYGG